MWINKNIIPFTKIIKPRTVIVDEVQYPKNIFTKWSEIELNAIGLYTVTISGYPNRRYYTAETVENFDTDTPSITYNAIPRRIEDVQDLMIKDLEAISEDKAKEPILDTSYGYSVRGSRDDLDSFERGKKKE